MVVVIEPCRSPSSHDTAVPAVVVVREDTPGDKRLVGYVVGTAEESALRTELSRSLPGYMVPSALVRLEQLRLNDASGIPGPLLALPAPAVHWPRLHAYDLTRRNGHWVVRSWEVGSIRQ